MPTPSSNPLFSLMSVYQHHLMSLTGLLQHHFFFNVWHSVLPDSHIIIYSTNPILLSIFTIVNNAEMNMLAVEHLYYSPMMNFLKENCWSILTNRLPKTSCQFMFPPIKSSSVPYLDCRQPFFSLQQQQPDHFLFSVLRIFLSKYINLVSQPHKASSTLSSSGDTNSDCRLLPVFHHSHQVLLHRGPLIIR